MRYILSCDGCRFRADAPDLGILGAQLNAHASNCRADPVLALAGKPVEERCTPGGLDAQEERHGVRNEEVGRVSLCG